ncbi:MAG: PQQ-binding-like beta-propeller repeat protein, partial [Planctomycetota bacterium]
AALNRDTGDVVWRISRGSFASYSSPLLTSIDGTDHLVITGGSKMVSYDPANGEERWSIPAIAMSTCGTAVTDGKNFYASGGYPKKQTLAVEAATGKVLWENREKIYEPSMVVVGDILFGISDKGIAHAWKTSDGERLWRQRMADNFSGSPIVIGDHVFATSNAGNTVVLSVGEKYEQVASNSSGDDGYCTPAFSNGRLFLRTGKGAGGDRSEQLICIGAESPIE